MINIAQQVDFNRVIFSPKIASVKKKKLGQFFTPIPIADFMASLFEDTWEGNINLLDAGAGLGSLFTAFIQRSIGLAEKPELINIDAYEIDGSLSVYLEEAFEACRELGKLNGIHINGQMISADFIERSVERLRNQLFENNEKSYYSHVIINPPYRKILTQSRERRLLKEIGIETSNLYSAFVALAIRQLRPGGQLVAITPRSFCNGPYFRSFRKLFVENMGLRKIHVFACRDKAFSDDDVLQENIIIHAVKGDYVLDAEISTSTDQQFDDLTSKKVPVSEIICPSDNQYVINVPALHDQVSFKSYLDCCPLSLRDLGLKASTGRVVDYRSKPFLEKMPTEESVGLIYPAHFSKGSIKYPLENFKKWNAIQDCAETGKMLLPQGNYILIKRFSPKEEKIRISAAYYNPSCSFGNKIAFENHLNFIHAFGGDIDESLAKGLYVYLSSTFLDIYFRQFSGHTQVNVSDIERLPYPARDALIRIGKLIEDVELTQDEIDFLIEKEVFVMGHNNKHSLVNAEKKIKDGLEVLKSLGMPKGQLNERSALTLLALLNIKPDSKWIEAEQIKIGITPIMEFCETFYSRNYAPNTRETFRRQTMHQFIQAGIVIENPDCPDRPTNSPSWCYQINDETLALFQSYSSQDWNGKLEKYLKCYKSLALKYERTKKMAKIPVLLGDGHKLELSPGKHNLLTKEIIEEFAPRFTPGGEVVYAGDTGDKFGGCFNEEFFEKIKVGVDTHGKMPDVVIDYGEKNWIVLIEAVTSHGPVDGKRRIELSELFESVKSRLVYVTCFLNRNDMAKYVSEISWETEVWVADSPTHLIHFNGERFLGPYDI